MTTREIGNIGENFTVPFLLKHGCEILERNFTVRGGEIDIIAKKGNVIHFVEVKSRKQNSLTSAQSAVTKNKRSNIIRAAREYIARNDIDCTCVFDVATVEINYESVTGFNYIQRAFTA